MKDKIIFQENDFRIIEVIDIDTNLDSLKGDCFKPESLDKKNPEYTIEELKVLEEKFENEVYDAGIFGYKLEKWNPTIDIGWEEIDSCYGFVGSYDPKIDKYDHYIIEELKDQIETPLEDLHNFLHNFLCNHFGGGLKSALAFEIENNNMPEEDGDKIIELLVEYKINFERL